MNRIQLANTPEVFRCCTSYEREIAAVRPVGVLADRLRLAIATSCQQQGQPGLDGRLEKHKQPQVKMLRHSCDCSTTAEGGAPKAQHCLGPSFVLKLSTLPGMKCDQKSSIACFARHTL